ncbi:hypothetical protein NC77_02520 [Janthinobacterium lividum]|nr:hypothetical protein NC77_02520 [Janthinobacterium lividum]
MIDKIFFIHDAYCIKNRAMNKHETSRCIFCVAILIILAGIFLSFASMIGSTYPSIKTTTGTPYFSRIKEIYFRNNHSFLAHISQCQHFSQQIRIIKLNIIIEQ